MAVVSAFERRDGSFEAVIRERPSYGSYRPERDSFLSNEDAILQFSHLKPSTQKPQTTPDISGSVRVSKDRDVHVVFKKGSRIGSVSLDTTRAVHSRPKSGRVYYDYLNRVWFDEMKGRIVNTQNKNDWYGIPPGNLTRVTFSLGRPVFETFKPVDPKARYCLPEEPKAICSVWIGRPKERPVEIPNMHLVAASSDRKVLVLANSSNSKLTQIRFNGG